MLTSTQNPLVKQIRKLHRSKERKEKQLFLLEGTHLIEEACQVNYPLETICCTPEWQEKHQKLWEIASSRAQRSEIVASQVLEAIATTVNPDGIVATASRKILTNTNSSPSKLGLALETIQDPGNLGTIIRTATAAGVDHLYLSKDSVDIDHPKVLRASAGALFRLCITEPPDLKTEIMRSKEQNIQVVATLSQGEKNYWELDFRSPTLILLGNEGAGLSDDLINLADEKVKIPLNQGIESLNVAIAAAIILYEAQRQNHFNP